jgi:uncharacterized protein (TIGR00730 family)
MRKIKSLAVFCGASTTNDQNILDNAAALGKLMAKESIELIYGGAKIGIMGAVADAVLAHGGNAIGVLPYFLQTKEVAHEKLNELIICESMHERKTKMYELSDAFMALPGGFGTMDELFEILTWAQLGLHQKPIGLLNINGFFSPLCTMVDTMLEKGLINKNTHRLLLVDADIEGLLEKMKNYIAPDVPKWLDSNEDL